MGAMLLLGAFVLLAQEAPDETVVSPQTVESFNLQLGGILEADAAGLYYGPAATFLVNTEHLRLYGALRMVNDGRWLPTEGWMDEGVYFNLMESHVQVLAGDFTLEGGFQPADHWYSQNPNLTILNTNGRSSVGLAYRYDGDMISYQSRWVGLNLMSPFTYGYGIDSGGIDTPFDQTWRDRGLNYKLYLLKFGQLRLGYQESSLYLDRYFDINYFVNPAPSILINTLWSSGQSGANPWIHSANDSSLMGFYADYTDKLFRAEAEFNIKDLNLPFGYTDNLNKLAWSAGFSWYSDYGTFSFWHGGATKHMFASTYQVAGNPNFYPYEYTYYPLDVVSGRTIALEDNYIGWPHGENSLAFSLAWQHAFQIWELPIVADVAAEWVISGSKSPHNPWHEFGSCSEIDNTTELFTGDTVLEHQLALQATATTRWRCFAVSLDFQLGVIINALGLEAVPETIYGVEPPIWRPQAGVVRNTSAFNLTLLYILEL
ncbi:MAG: hypothetical protein A2087_06615 [Spirochaetes bacterium GWD1_61_31]|nr:MAG: hypothetical protein A2Y37_08855 [Spirochaetes bacterium GWB1_60_80]OHD31881.1 MAG: hypothetical protein A2004_10240 [Spirochaetes bacterium GWC1_61_12]OHD40022.1 MAG: hypothetical protein A2087_06615 [Spirochaetes bacterium GWD1_61_31]OHD42324.1 MAG: hypothetical protein A2Y35_11385 [Spirochaetes bacterium GWE1_60_18]OHD58474.1 MAG: hypothetical protein A2Y32_06890 [Spirochaetes bacterium GWF1_60_12]HAW85465.1 hypothetical protein [Spirochaetaceae bacterium]